MKYIIGTPKERRNAIAQVIAEADGAPVSWPAGPYHNCICLSFPLPEL